MDILQAAVPIVVGGVVVMIGGFVIWNDVLRPKMRNYLQDQQNLNLEQHRALTAGRWADGGSDGGGSGYGGGGDGGGGDGGGGDGG